MLFDLSEVEKLINLENSKFLLILFITNTVIFY